MPTFTHLHWGAILAFMFHDNCINVALFLAGRQCGLHCPVSRPSSRSSRALSLKQTINDNFETEAFLNAETNLSPQIATHLERGASDSAEQMAATT